MENKAIALEERLYNDLMAGVDIFKNVLHCSVEAIIYEHEEYWPLFTTAEREGCKKRLMELGFFK